MLGRGGPLKTTIQLNSGATMPRAGFGTFRLVDFETCRRAVLQALDAGYRLIDTAQVYRNEAAVGAALKETTVPREQIFVTTKVWLPFFGHRITAASVDDSLKRLGLDYLDLVLLHEPYGDYYGAYRDLERLVQAGKVRSVGVSNFDAGQLIDLSHQMAITPAVNQVELNVYQQQVALRQAHGELGIVTEGWAPLGEDYKAFLAEPMILAIAKQHGKTVAQILLRYLLQLNTIVIPSTTNLAHLRANATIWDFELSKAEMAQLARLDKKRWLSPDRHSVKATQHYMKLIDEGLEL